MLPNSKLSQPNTATACQRCRPQPAAIQIADGFELPGSPAAEAREVIYWRSLACRDRRLKRPIDHRGARQGEADSWVRVDALDQGRCLDLEAVVSIHYSFSIRRSIFKETIGISVHVVFSIQILI